MPTIESLRVVYWTAYDAETWSREEAEKAGIWAVWNKCCEDCAKAVGEICVRYEDGGPVIHNDGPDRCRALKHEKE